MSDNSTILLSNDEGNTIKIDLSVLETILGMAAQQVDGVVGMRGSLRSNLSTLLGREDHGKGVSLHVDDNNILSGDVYVYLQYGVNVPQVAGKLQKQLIAQLRQMTDLRLPEINVHVVGLLDEKANAAKEQDK
ncbi:MAG: Asp23/Gls24 family envelope stress response protein [Lactobacillus sp.]